MTQNKDNTDAYKSPWYLKKGFIFVNLFFVLGPLAFPLLWKSREFTKKEKYIYTLIVVTLTVLVIAAGSYITVTLYKHYQYLNDVMNELY
ncbi:MAG: hypothetical protein KAI43_00875 [Candidatus Aureabacteria bacterium]|nr:hypothetical protein [Candidatus Auribacterota bacterium]